MPTRSLPLHPSLEQLKRQAKDLLRAHRARDAAALQRIREFHPRFRDASDTVIAQAVLKLSDAQFAIAREYGFRSWRTLRAYLDSPERADLHAPKQERIHDPVLRKAVDLIDAGDAEALRMWLQAHPGLVRQRVIFEGGNYFQNPALLEFIAENPIRNEKLAPNIIEITRVLLEAGAKDDREALDSTLGLVCSGRVVRECGVQISLIDLLCDYGADADSAMMTALAHGEFAAAEALLRRGAALSLSVAAATGRSDAARGLLPRAGSAERHRALALAAQFGHAPVVAMLLDAGEDPNRFNPIGVHSHSTPLHEAAVGGHMEVVRLLVGRGAKRDIKDIRFHNTPLRWAQYAGRDEIAEYLASGPESDGPLSNEAET